MADGGFLYDDTELQRLMRALKQVTAKKYSVISWKVGKEAMFGIIKATPVRKNFAAYRIQVKGSNKPILDRHGEEIFVKSPKKWDKKAAGTQGKEGFLSPKGRRYTKIPTGKRFLSSAWYTARMGFKIKTGKVGGGAKAAGSFFSGDSDTESQLVFENLVPYAGTQDQQKQIVSTAMKGAEDYLRSAIEKEIAKNVGAE